MSSSRVFIVGAGVIGLRTAIELVRRGIPVVVRASKHPLDNDVCSQGAGGMWMPFHCDDPRTDRWAMETLGEIHSAALSGEKLDDELLVEIMPSVEFFTSAPQDLPSWTSDCRIKSETMTVKELWEKNRERKLKIPNERELATAGYKHAWSFETPVVNSPKVLMHLMQELEDSPLANIEVGTGVEYQSMEDIVELAKIYGCNKVVNCTGLGAGKLCGDDKIVGARGVLLQFDRRNCTRASSMNEAHGPMENDSLVFAETAPWGNDTYPSYLIVRANTVVVGGTYLEGDTEPTMRPAERKRLLQNARRLGIDTDKTQPKGEWVGFRPYRPTSRLEIDTKYSTDDIRVVHSYGYGGSGWTVFVGCAREATELLFQETPRSRL